MKLMQNKKASVALLFLLAFAATSAIASGTAGTTGGLTTAQTTATSVQTGFFALVGACAGLYVLYVGVMAFTEKKTWADFGWSIIHVVAVGGSLAAATWAWGIFSGTT
jgi:hypothetical protein